MNRTKLDNISKENHRFDSSSDSRDTSTSSNSSSTSNSTKSIKNNTSSSSSTTSSSASSSQSEQQTIKASGQYNRNQNDKDDLIRIDLNSITSRTSTSTR